MQDQWWNIDDKKALEEARIRNNASNAHLLAKELYIFDQDGTLYLDFELLPHVKEFLEYLREGKRNMMFISNNSSKSSTTYRNRLSEILGMEISEEQVFTSTLATIHYLESKGIQKVYPLGTPDFQGELEDHGIELTEDDPQVVLLGFDTTLTYEKLKKASLLIQGGVDYIATHPDKVCPTREGYIPDIGSFIALIETATGIKPKAILGKPSPDMITPILGRFGLNPAQTLIFGDRLYTDIRMGTESGLTTALMLTGESRVRDIKKYGYVPDFAFQHFGEALDLLKKEGH